MKNKQIVQAKSTLKSQGFNFSDNQHNGILYAKLTGNTLHRAVIDHLGQINYYIPTKANKHQRKIYS